MVDILFVDRYCCQRHRLCILLTFLLYTVLFWQTYPVTITMTEIQQPPQPGHEIAFPPKEPPKLRSNHGNYVDSGAVSWLRPTALSVPLEEMRERYAADGYLWVKHLIPREDVNDMREL